MCIGAGPRGGVTDQAGGRGEGRGLMMMIISLSRVPLSMRTALRSMMIIQFLPSPPLAPYRTEELSAVEIGDTITVL